MNEKRILFIANVGVYHFLLTALADELLKNGNSVHPFLFTHDTPLSDPFHHENACPFPNVTTHYTLS
jgi:hypothetical protein